MHRFYFPRCPVEGPTDPPVSYAHGASRGAIPNKCGGCEHSFEGSCARFTDELQRYMHLDHGPCGVDGPTDPVVYEDEFVTSKVEIPRKCADCVFLTHGPIYGFTCRKDEEKWGDCRRGLDWGGWSPERIHLELPPPRVTTKALVDFAYDEERIRFITEHRRVNPGLSMQEAKADYAHLRALISKRAANADSDA
ncbi:MAG: hypothetical protein AB8H86_24390 [Polyangiales bacterium]